MPTKSGNEIKSEFLGVPYGTACSKLRKRLLFSLARKLGEAFCYRDVVNLLNLWRSLA